MAEESDLEKTEPASPRRVEKAREDGHVARSRELATFVLLSAAICGLWLIADSLGQSMEAAFRQGLKFDRAAAFDAPYMLTQTAGMALQVLWAIAPFFVMMVAAAAIAPLMLGGWIFSGKSIAPDFSKMNPVAGIGRMFSTQSLADLVKSLAKALLVGGVGYWVIQQHLPEIQSLMSEPERAALHHTIALVGRCSAWIVASLFLLALIDVPFQLWTYFRKLRMSKEDLRQEHKESEGDPHVKARIRGQQRQAARRRMMDEVPKADIVLTNPTHFAVALKYIDTDMRAPRVVAKGTDLVAQRIREIAGENKVSILEAPTLARALYKHTKLGGEIPAGLYTAVAAVLAWVYQLKRWQDEGGEAPHAPTELPVPAELEYPARAA